MKLCYLWIISCFSRLYMFQLLMWNKHTSSWNKRNSDHWINFFDIIDAVTRNLIRNLFFFSLQYGLKQVISVITAIVRWPALQTVLISANCISNHQQIYATTKPEIEKPTVSHSIRRHFHWFLFFLLHHFLLNKLHFDKHQI